MRAFKAQTGTAHHSSFPRSRARARIRRFLLSSIVRCVVRHLVSLNGGGIQVSSSKHPPAEPGDLPADYYEHSTRRAGGIRKPQDGGNEINANIECRLELTFLTLTFLYPGQVAR
jgi:hypothetical protein